MQSDKKIILVVGMHSSGTSALTGVLDSFGVQIPLASNRRIHPDNPKGHWEHTEVNRINDNILRQFSCTWTIPPAIKTNDIDQRYRGQIQSFLHAAVADDATSIVGIKDPRLCLLLPVWLDAIERLGCESRVFLCVRHPGQVANSILTRDGYAKARGLFLWLRYNILAIQALENRECHKVMFPSWLSSISTLYADTTEDGWIKWPNAWEDCRQNAEAFADHELVHAANDSSEESWLETACQALYDMLADAPARLRPSENAVDLGVFTRQHDPGLDAMSQLLEDERRLWRDKINAMYYLVNRNG